jgi:hypothetical protein
VPVYIEITDEDLPAIEVELGERNPKPVANDLVPIKISVCSLLNLALSRLRV